MPSLRVYIFYEDCVPSSKSRDSIIITCLRPQQQLVSCLASRGMRILWPQRRLNHLHCREREAKYRTNTEATLFIIIVQCNQREKDVKYENCLKIHLGKAHKSSAPEKVREREANYRTNTEAPLFLS